MTNEVYIYFGAKELFLYRQDIMQIPAHNRNYVRAQFGFSADWNSMEEIKVIFAREGIEPVERILTADRDCQVPGEMLTEPGNISVSVHAGDLKVTNPATITVIPSDYQAITPPDPPTPPTPGGWVRPADRPPIPEIAEDEDVIYWLFGVSEASPNDYAIALTTSGEDYIIEWGDGEVEAYNSGVKAEHLFDYAMIPGEPNEQGYKWVWIKAYPSYGRFIKIDTAVRHSLRPAPVSTNIFVPQIFEWYMQAPEVYEMPFSAGAAQQRFGVMDIFDYRGENRIEDFTYFLAESWNLKSVNAYTGNGIIFSYFLYNNIILNQPMNFDTSRGEIFNNCLQSCRAQNQPINMDTSRARDLSNFGANMTAFNQPFHIDTSKAEKLLNFFANNTSFNQVMIVDLANATSAIGTSFMTGNKSLKGLRLLNMGLAHNSVNASEFNLDVDAIVDLFGDLADRTSTTAGTINITRAFGANRLVSWQRAIATDKGWNIVG